MKKLFAMVSLADSREYTNAATRSFFEHTPLFPGDSFLMILNDEHKITLPKKFPIEGTRSRIQAIKNDTPQSFAENVNLAREHALLSRSDLYFLNNDIIFTPAWLSPLLIETQDVLIPNCNQHAQYSYNGWDIERAMDLADYKGHTKDLLEIVAEHTADGYQQMLRTPFYAVKIPLQILEEVGPFDTGFGKGGGEDMDYCIRTYLAGHKVMLARKPYLLHFMGKSTWRGTETADETKTRDDAYYEYFKKKWGEPLTTLCLDEDQSVIPKEFRKYAEANNWKPVIEHLKK